MTSASMDQCIDFAIVPVFHKQLIWVDSTVVSGVEFNLQHALTLYSFLANIGCYATIFVGHGLWIQAGITIY